MRAFRTADADDVQRLAGQWSVADTTLNIPHPYEDGLAEKWISNHRDWFERRQQAVFAITLPGPPETLVGAIELRADRDDQRGELGYWIGTPYQRQGYATEATLRRGSSASNRGSCTASRHAALRGTWPRSECCGRSA